MSVRLYGETVEGATLLFDLEMIEKVISNDNWVLVQNSAGVDLEVVLLDTIKVVNQPVQVEKIGSYTDEFFRLLGDLEAAVGDINYSADPLDVHWQTRRSAILQRIRFLHKMSAAEVVKERDEFMRVLRELLGLNEPVTVWDLKNTIIGAVRMLVDGRDRFQRQLVQRLETDLQLAIDEDLPLLSRTRIVRERIRILVRQTSALEWFLSEVEMAVGLLPDETPTQNERMHKVIKLLAELVDRP